MREGKGVRLHTIIDMAKIMPPPLKTIVECEERSFGLSMILHLSAILKYSNSAANNMAAIIKYVIQLDI